MTDHSPLVTVIIASYNHAPYIEASIMSVLNQTYPNIELLVIDDGSTDDSVERIRGLQEKYGFDFQVQKNRGLASTLNEAIARSRGSLIVPFGSDDIMLPERIARQVAYMSDKPEVGICSGDIECIDSEGNLLPKEKKYDVAVRRFDFDDVFSARRQYIYAPTLMIRKEAFEKTGGLDPAIHLEDVQLQLKITYAGYYIDRLNDVFAHYRKHGQNTYKNFRFMTDSLLRTYDLFRNHPKYDVVRIRALISMFLKSSNRDKSLARELLAQIPFRYWNKKVWRGLWRLYFSPVRKK